MTASNRETPVEEYERQFAERRHQARVRIVRCMLLFVLGHVAAVVIPGAISLAAFFAFGIPDHASPAMKFTVLIRDGSFLIIVASLFAIAGAAAWVTLKNWPVLPRRWIAGGLALWPVLVAETTWLWFIL